MQHKLDETPEGEPLDSFSRDAQAGNGELLLNIPSEARGIVGIEKGTTLEITLYRTGYFVEVKQSGDTDGDQ